MISVDESKQPIVILVLVTMIAGAIFSIVLHIHRRSVNVPYGQINLAQVVAEETDKLLAHHGQVVVVTTDPAISPDRERQLKTLKTTWEKLGHITIVATEIYKYTLTDGASDPSRCRI